MVLEDFDLHPGSNEGDFPLAAPIDRIGSFIIDLTFFTPLMTLIGAPFKKKVVMSALLGLELQSVGYGFLFLCVAGLTGMLLQSFFLHRFKATPGMLILRLRLQTLNHSELSFFQAFQRTFFQWFGNVVMLFLPALGILVDPKRSPFYDRLIRAVVVNRNGDPASTPSDQERSLAHGILTFTMLMGLPVFLYGGFMIFSQVFSEKATVGELERSQMLCEEVGEAMKNWPDKKSGSRLDIALTLFAAGKLVPSCLNREAEFQVWNREPTAQTYLAKAFAHMEQSALSNLYLEEVCKQDKDSQSCQLSSTIQLQAEAKWGQLKEAFEKINVDSAPHIKLWAIRHYNEAGQPKRAQELIRSLETNTPVAAFLAKQRVQSLLLDHRVEQSGLVFSTLLGYLNVEERQRFSNRTCYQLLNQDCSLTHHEACSYSLDKVESNPFLLADEDSALLLFKSQSCKGVSSRKLASDFEATGMERLIIAINKSSQSLGSLYHIAFGEVSLLAEEAKQQIVSRAKSQSELNEMIDRWESDYFQNHHWAQLGHALVGKLLKWKKYGQALKLSQNFEGTIYKNEEQRFKEMVIALYHLKRHTQARKIYRRLQKAKLKNSSRLPAQNQSLSAAVAQFEREIQ